MAVRCYKHKGRWGKPNGTSAGQTLAELRLDLEDLVVVQLPAYHACGESDPEELSRTEWRRRLMSWMRGRAREKALREGCPYEEWSDSDLRIGDNGPPERWTGRSSLRRATATGTRGPWAAPACWN
ncbi:hypothetical protein [Streptomyces anulatus]|uniref:hypothetical protein n=1 Tax=Streptomyces anulatus TaxID=1892 RepID=UPI002ED24203|nr:hypothetical protein OG703_00435 [Streptomyces anulatus]